MRSLILIMISYFVLYSSLLPKPINRLKKTLKINEILNSCNDFLHYFI